MPKRAAVEQAERRRLSILADVARGVPVREIATRFGISMQRVRQLVRTRPVSKPAAERLAREHASVEQLADGGLTLAELATALHLSPQRVESIIEAAAKRREAERVRPAPTSAEARKRESEARVLRFRR